MSDFFPDPPDASEQPEDNEPEPAWVSPPEDMFPGIVPVELIIGRSDQAVVMLAGMRAFPTGIAMTLMVRTRGRSRRFDLNDEMFEGPYRHDQDETWNRDRLKWGFEFADGRRATSVDLWPELGHTDQTPDRPVLSPGAGGSSVGAVDLNYWLWPLPTSGALTVVCQ